MHLPTASTTECKKGKRCSETVGSCCSCVNLLGWHHVAHIAQGTGYWGCTRISLLSRTRSTVARTTGIHRPMLARGIGVFFKIWVACFEIDMELEGPVLAAFRTLIQWWPTKRNKNSGVRTYADMLSLNALLDSHIEKDMAYVSRPDHER